MGSLTVLATYALGKLVHSKFVGITASIFLAFSFLHVHDSHFGVPDITATLFVVVAIFLTYHAVQGKLVKSLVFAAAAAGLAVTIKWSVWPVIVPVALGVFSFAQAAPVGQARCAFFEPGHAGCSGFCHLLFCPGFPQPVCSSI